MWVRPEAASSGVISRTMNGRDESAEGSIQTISAMIQPPRMARTKASLGP